MTRFVCSVCLWVVGACTCLAQTGLDYLDKTFHLYDSIQKRIHGLAEPGYCEYQSVEVLAGHLRENGFSIEAGVAGLPTAFVATYGKGSPVIGLLAEYDALPGLSQDTVPYQKALAEGGTGHGCGHNLIGTASVAAAVALSKWLSQGNEGTVKLFGCPAEEGGGGKLYMAREGCFNGVDAVLDWHPDVNNVVNTESGLANVQICFKFFGKAAHAASAPDKGRSALDAVEAFNYMMNLMREHVPAGSRIHYIITHGGQAPNVVPDYAEVVYYLRNPDRRVVEDLKGRAIQAARGAAMGTGTQSSYEILSGNYERLYNQTLSQLVQNNLERVGGVHYNAREQEFAETMMANSGIENREAALEAVAKVLPLGVDYPTSRWVSSDVGNVTWMAPTASFRIAAFVPAGGGHCWQQVSSGGMTIGTKGLMNAARVMYLTAYELFISPESVRCARLEFEEKRGAGFAFVPLVGDRKPPLDYRLPKK